MRVACIISRRELNTAPVDLVIFPEGIFWDEIREAAEYNSDALIVGAVEESGNMRAVLWHHGQNRIDYQKVATDGRSLGVGVIQQNAIYEYADLCIGVLICMDIDHVEWSNTVIASMKSSHARLKLLCMPADMGSYWLEGDSLPFPHKYEGLHVLVCNHTRTHQSRCKSFIADVSGRKVAIQNEQEPIYAEL